MQAGLLRHRVTFQQLAEQKDAHGADKNNWEDVCTVYARVSPLSGRSLFAAQQNHSEVTGTIETRYRPDLNAKMRAVFEGKIYSLHAMIDPEMRHRELRFMVSEGVREN